MKLVGVWYALIDVLDGFIFGFGKLLKECLNTKVTDYIFNEYRN